MLDLLGMLTVDKATGTFNVDGTPKANRVEIPGNYFDGYRLVKDRTGETVVSSGFAQVKELLSFDDKVQGKRVIQISALRDVTLKVYGYELDLE